ncbi:hypothetical protein [Leifsonia xyli]|uniref:hypothetical protein n=1 Tax=Leifsonia xyli TaxID=1575 RepID=UPI002E7FE3B2|nr:hypothetical protein [Leifsonia xyli]
MTASPSLNFWAALQLDREVLRVLGRDRLGDVVVRGALGVVVGEAGEELVHDETAAGLVRVAGDEAALRLGAPGADDAGTAATVRIRGRSAAGEGQSAGGHRADDESVFAHV